MDKVREFFCVIVIAVLSVHSQPVTKVARIKECCGIVSEWETCHSKCLQFASTCPPAVGNKTEYLTDYCPEVPVELTICFDNLNQTGTPPAPTVSPELAACCGQSSDPNCVDVCLESPIWSCFLTLAGTVSAEEDQSDNSDDAVDDVPIECNATATTDPTVATEPTEPPIPIHNADWSRLQCCARANNTECRRACLLEYTGGRTSDSWNTLELDCKFRPTEESLIACLDDTMSQCLLGCSSQLKFCENFNNRPLTLFRNCHNESDQNAKEDFTSWFTRSEIVHPLVTVSLTENCPLEHLKTVACAFHLQPCHPDTHSSLICQEDCLSLMRGCSASETQTPEEICEILSPTYLQDNCLSLEEFLVPSPYTAEESSFTDSPCNSNPCANGYKCIVNKDCLSSDKTCAPYKCPPACQLGLKPSTILEETEVAHVATVPSGSRECFGYVNRTIGVCKFGPKESDVWAEYCIENQECEYNGVLRAHGEVFESGDNCNFCVCMSGQVNCTNHVCPMSKEGGPPLPSCNCILHYAPICTKDKRTWPNYCFAACHGYNLSEATLGACREKDPCDSVVCPSGSKCIPNPHVCLTGKVNSIKNCPQYLCENYTTCMDNPHTLICDKKGINHHSICDFIFKREKVDYFGYCQDHCFDDRRGAVCGVDSETYESVCHANGLGVAVDYIGECDAIPSSSNGSPVKCPRSTKCPTLPYFGNTICTGPVPPGACCEQCGGMMRTIVDNALLERNIAIVKEISFFKVLSRLAAHIDVISCTLNGYIAQDGTYVFLALPVNTTSFLNLQLCNNEITRLASLINRHSPVMASDPFLSHLVAANYTHATNTTVVNRVYTGSTSPEANSGRKSDTNLALLTLSIIVLLLCTIAPDTWQR